MTSPQPTTSKTEHDARVARAMTERQLEDAVAGRAKVYRWLRYHTHRSDRSAPGFPDDVLVRDGRILFLELKTEAGKVSAPQTVWLDALEQLAAAVEHDSANSTRDASAALITVRVIRPRDLLDGTLDRLLA